MSWSRVDDQLHAHRKVIGTPLDAMGLWVLTLSWAGSDDDEGHVPAKLVGRLGGTLKQAASLVESGLWEEHPDGGWQIHDWADYRAGSDALEARRARDRARKARQRSRDTSRDCPRDVRVMSPSPVPVPVPDPTPTHIRPPPAAPAELTLGACASTPAAGEGDAVRAAARRLLAHWVERTGQKLTWKTWGSQLQARVREHGEDGVRAVLDWAVDSGHDRAVYLRDHGLGLSTLVRPKNCETYLGFARGGNGTKRRHEPKTVEDWQAAYAGRWNHDTGEIMPEGEPAP